MRFGKDIQIINETITSINNLEFGMEYQSDNDSMPNKKKPEKHYTSGKENFLRTKRVKQVHPCLWQLISITLGVDPQRKEDPGVVSSILELLTVGSALSNTVDFPYCLLIF